MNAAHEGLRAPGMAPDHQPSMARDFHLFQADDETHLLLVDGSQLFRIDEELGRQLAAAERLGGHATREVLAEHGLGLKTFIGDKPLGNPAVRALSLAVAERCNLGCTYCYADGGSFGGPAQAWNGMLRRRRFGACLPRPHPASVSLWRFSAANRLLIGR